MIHSNLRLIAVCAAVSALVSATAGVAASRYVVSNSAQIRPGVVKTYHLSNGTRMQLKGIAGPAGPQGPKGPPGVAGLPSASGTARVGVGPVLIGANTRAITLVQGTGRIAVPANGRVAVVANYTLSTFTSGNGACRAVVETGPGTNAYTALGLGNRSYSLAAAGSTVVTIYDRSPALAGGSLNVGVECSAAAGEVSLKDLGLLVFTTQ